MPEVTSWPEILFIEFITREQGGPTLHYYQPRGGGPRLLWGIGGTGERYHGEGGHDYWWVASDPTQGIIGEVRIEDTPLEEGLRRIRVWRA